MPWKLGFDGYRRGSVGIGVCDGVGVGVGSVGGGGVVFLVGCGSKLYMYALEPGVGMVQGETHRRKEEDGDDVQEIRARPACLIAEA